MTTFKRINIDQAKTLMETLPVSIVDIRDPGSYSNGHIENALLLDNNTVAQFIENTPQDNTIIVYCYHGNSSQQASQFFVEQGFNQVYSLDGGFELWRQDNAVSTR